MINLVRYLGEELLSLSTIIPRDMSMYRTEAFKQIRIGYMISPVVSPAVAKQNSVPYNLSSEIYW